jgi:hypothetical protein
MLIVCAQCDNFFDDTQSSAICPHADLNFMSRADLPRKDLALRLVGKTLRFAHEPNGPNRRIHEILWNGMIRLAGMEGEFAPDRFIVAEHKP